MSQRVLWALCALIVFALPARAADTSCSPKNHRPAELVRAINCLQQRVITLEANQQNFVGTNDPRLNNLVHKDDPVLKDLVHQADLTGVLRTGSSFKLGFDSNRCLAAPSGWSGDLGSPPRSVSILTLLQDCGGAPTVKINP